MRKKTIETLLGMQGIHKMNQSLKGLTYKNLERLRKVAGLSKSEIARILGISVSTLSRRKETGKLSIEESDKAYRIARIFSEAIDCFGDIESARSWIHKPILALGRIKPIDCLCTNERAKEVSRLLIQIDRVVYI
jgi:putative toxin-antitoxin system antitoxin component (TIGR02293 family)